MPSVTEDFSPVKPVFDKPAGYTTGDTITVSLSGVPVVTTSETINLVEQLTDPATGLSGSTSGSVPLSAKSSGQVQATSASDGTARVWTVSADGKTATAVA